MEGACFSRRTSDRIDFLLRNYIDYMKISKKLILNESKEIRDFIDKNKKLPTYATIDGSKLTPAQYSYMMAKQISSMKLDGIEKITVKEAVSPVGDKISTNVLKARYVDMANRMVKYVEQNKVAPNYVTIDGKIRARFELYTYCFAKILAYYKENNTLPNYCIFNSTDIKYNLTTASNTKKTTAQSTSTTKKTTKKDNCTNPYTSSPHPTNSGCNGMGQNTNYFCGVSALHKMLKKFGITKFSQNQLAKWAGTTTNGTDHNGLETAVAKVSKETGIKLTCKWYHFSDLGFEKLAKMICKPNQDALVHLYYRNKYGHYEVINQIDMKNSTLKVLNSLGNKCGQCYCGYVENRTFATEKQYINGISQKSILIVIKG